MKIPVRNNSAMPIYVGAAMVPPGETRHFDKQDVPHHLRPVEQVEAVVEAPADPLAELLKGNVKEVVAALAGLSIADIERLGDLEQQGHARKGVLNAIADIQLNHAAQADTMAKVAALDDEALAAALAEAGTDINADPDYVAALEAEAVKRNPGAVE